MRLPPDRAARPAPAYLRPFTAVSLCRSVLAVCSLIAVSACGYDEAKGPLVEAASESRLSMSWGGPSAEQARFRFFLETPVRDPCFVLEDAHEVFLDKEQLGLASRGGWNGVGYATTIGPSCESVFSKELDSFEPGEHTLRFVDEGGELLVNFTSPEFAESDEMEVASCPFRSCGGHVFDNSPSPATP